MTSLSTVGYELARPTGVCAATGRAIGVGEKFVAALVERHDRLERMDFSVRAWDEGERPPRPARMFGFWRSTMPAPNAKVRAFVDDEALLDLFSQMDGAAEPGRVAFRYILALILIRKRLLRHEGKKDGVLLVRVVRQEGPAIRVVEPQLDDATIAEATDQLSEIVRGGNGRG